MIMKKINGSKNFLYLQHPYLTISKIFDITLNMSINSIKTNNEIDVLIIVPPLRDYDSEVDRKAGKPDFENKD